MGTLMWEPIQWKASPSTQYDIISLKSYGKPNKLEWDYKQNQAPGLLLTKEESSFGNQ